MIQEEEGSTFEADSKWTHDCAKEIIAKLGIKYNVFQMYDIVRILKKYMKDEKSK